MCLASLQMTHEPCSFCVVLKPCARIAQDEYSLVEALKAGAITKPVVAWVSGTCATLFKSEVQFGHAGAKSGGALESAQVRKTTHRAAVLDGKHQAVSSGQAVRSRTA